ncbi:MAG: hypothetical protein FWG27_01580 [Treponema sp.]|nr:hypothetical protein [Treponema sp.]
MKKTLIFLSLLSFLGPLFAFEISGLEKEIIMAGPEDMIRLVLDRGNEEDLYNIYKRIEANIDGYDAEEVFNAFSLVFPETDKKEYIFMMFKLFLVVSLGSGDREMIEMGLELLEYLDEINVELAESTDLAEMLRDDLYLLDSQYLKDCLAFTGLFDSDLFIRQRFR